MVKKKLDVVTSFFDGSYSPPRRKLRRQLFLALFTMDRALQKIHPMLYCHSRAVMRNDEGHDSAVAKESKKYAGRCCQWKVTLSREGSELYSTFVDVLTHAANPAKRHAGLQTDPKCDPDKD